MGGLFFKNYTNSNLNNMQKLETEKEFSALKNGANISVTLKSANGFEVVSGILVLNSPVLKNMDIKTESEPFFIEYQQIESVEVFD